MVFCIAKMFNLENVTCVRKLSISQLANIIQTDTMDFLVEETWGYKINLVNKCGTASLGYFKNRAATGDLLQHYNNYRYSVHVNAGIWYLASLIYAYNWHQVYLLIHYVNTRISCNPFITYMYCIATIQQYTNMTLRSNLRFSKGVAFCNWNCPTTAHNLPLLSIVYA